MKFIEHVVDEDVDEPPSFSWVVVPSPNESPVLINPLFIYSVAIVDVDNQEKLFFSSRFMRASAVTNNDGIYT